MEKVGNLCGLNGKRLENVINCKIGCVFLRKYLQLTRMCYNFATVLGMPVATVALKSTDGVPACEKFRLTETDAI